MSLPAKTWLVGDIFSFSANMQLNGGTFIFCAIEEPFTSVPSSSHKKMEVLRCRWNPLFRSPTLSHSRFENRAGRYGGRDGVGVHLFSGKTLLKGLL